jgi:hypothetical protein
MGELRKAWQDFKKLHPDFEKSKDLKADFGPALDRHEDARRTMARAVDDICGSAARWDKAKDNLAVAVAGYKIAVRKRDKTPQIQKDFDKDFQRVIKYADVRSRLRSKHGLPGTSGRLARDAGEIHSPAYMPTHLPDGLAGEDL